MLGAESVPYSRKALENLAQALGVDTAVIWYNPTTNRIDLKETAKHDATRIMSAFRKIINIAQPNDAIGLIHGDLFPANIFVKEDGTEYKITNVIDWETATVGHTGYEQVLTAWWLAGEKGGNKEIFETIINSSTTKGNSKGFDQENLRSAVALADLFWHVNVIVSCTALGKMTNVPRWIRTLNEIISLVESNEPYAVFSGE